VRIFLFALAGTLVPGCKSRPAPEATPKEPVIERLTLLAAYEEAVMEDLLKAYLADRPEVEVRTVRREPGDLATRIREGDPEVRGDVVIGLPREEMEGLLRAGAIAKIHPPECNDLPAEYRDPGGHWIGLTISAIAFGVNEKLLAEKQLPAPVSWEDLTRARYRGWIVVARPPSSRAAQILVAGVTAMMHPRGWDYWRRLDRNLFQYTSSAAEPAKLAGRGETIIAIDQEKRLLAERREGKPIRLFYPKPTFYEVEGMAVLKGAPNPAPAARFASWVCGDRAMRVLERHRAGVSRPHIEPSDGWKARLTQIKLHAGPLRREQALAEWSDRYGK
jgi:iron(III) transport system substrate-binding protein